MILNQCSNEKIKGASMTGQYQPIDLPRLRNTMCDFARSPASEHFWKWRARQMSVDMEETWTGKQLQRQSICVRDPGYRNAELFWVGPEMAELAAHAATSLPDFVIEAPDVPTPRGFLLAPSAFAPPGITDPIERASYATHGFAWSTDAEGVSISYLTAKEPYLEACRAGGMSRAERRSMTRGLPPVFERQIAGWSEFGLRDTVEAPSAGHPLLTLKSAWLLMAQPIAATHEVACPAPAAAGRSRPPGDPQAVRVIMLRRATLGAGDSAASREYRHQWVVGGHWRQQWYPARETHRPIWIAPHIKGPEGKPLLGGEKVHAWTR